VRYSPARAGGTLRGLCGRDTITSDDRRRRGPARTALLSSLAAKWRGVFLEPTWCVDVAWSTSGEHAGAAYVCWELFYARIEVHPDLPDELLERVVVHELAELELYEVGRQVEAVASLLDEPHQQQALRDHAVARNRMIERRLVRLLPGARTVPLRVGGRFVASSASAPVQDDRGRADGRAEGYGGYG
jgi:hypothetical protein